MLGHHNTTVHGFGAFDRNDSTADQVSRPVREPELDEHEASRTRLCCKKLTRFMFSHIGLVGLVVVYAVAGGFLFELLEVHQEKIHCQEANGEQSAETTRLKQKLVAYIQYNTTNSLTTSNNYFDKDNITVALEKITSMLYDYRDFVLTTSSKYRSYGENCSYVNKWTFPNALLFAITIITTIGYGNITPVTWEGQICCVCYATMGIPIFLLCVANISGVLGEMFRFIYAKIICRPCFSFYKRRQESKRAKLKTEQDKEPGNDTNNALPNDDLLISDQRVAVPLTVTLIIITGYILIGALIFHNFEGWSITQGSYFCFITLATIGFGDFVPGQTKNDPNPGAKLVLGSVYVLFGMAILAMCFDLMQEEIVAKFRWIGRKIGIVEKHDEPVNKSEQSSMSGKEIHQKTSNPMQNESQASTLTQRTTIEDDKMHTSRRLSPLPPNPARIHPLSSDRAVAGTLHQRSISSKNE